MGGASTYRTPTVTRTRRGTSLGASGRKIAAPRDNEQATLPEMGKPGQPITDFWDVWRDALEAARLPQGRLFHDLRRSAVRTLIRAGVDESTAMRVSGHKTRSMLLRYNIVTERETADALLRADAYLSTQPRDRNVEEGQFGDIPVAAGAEVLTAQSGGGSSGRIRTYNPPVNSRMLYP